MKLKNKSKEDIKNFDKFFLHKTEEVARNFINLHNKKFSNNLLIIIKTIIHQLKKGGKIIFCGNGGSAGDAQHLTAELVGQYLNHRRKPISAISLTTNTSTITSISNDKNYNFIFSRQVKAIGKNTDILFAISTSGRSKNVINSLKTAKENGIKTILLTGQNKIKNKYIDFQINVPAQRVDRIQEMHIFVGHIICELLEKDL